MTLSRTTRAGKGLVGIVAFRPRTVPLTVDLPAARGEPTLYAHAGALVIYLLRLDLRPYAAMLGASVAMWALAFLLADIDAANQGPAWLASIAGTTGIGGGLAALAYHGWREWQRQTREDTREREAIARLDTREREFMSRMDRAYREHREQIRRELEEHQQRLDAINDEIAEAAKRRHAWAEGVNVTVLELETRLQEQAAEIARLREIVANGGEG